MACSTSAQDFAQHLPVPWYTTDAQGLVTGHNELAAIFAGRHPRLHEDRWCVTWRLYTVDGRRLPHDMCPMAVALKENRRVRGMSAIAERPDGRRVPFMPFPTPLHDGGGHVVGGINVLFDLSVQDAVLKQREQQLLSQRTDGLTLGLIRSVLTDESMSRHSCIRSLAVLSATDALLSTSACGVSVPATDVLRVVSVMAMEEIGPKCSLEIKASFSEVPAGLAFPIALTAYHLIQHLGARHTYARVDVELARTHCEFVLAFNVGGEQPRIVFDPSIMLLNICRLANAQLEVPVHPAGRITVTFTLPDLLN